MDITQPTASCGCETQKVLEQAYSKLTSFYLHTSNIIIYQGHVLYVNYESDYCNICNSPNYYFVAYDHGKYLCGKYGVLTTLEAHPCDYAIGFSPFISTFIEVPNLGNVIQITTYPYTLIYFDDYTITSKNGWTYHLSDGRIIVPYPKSVGNGITVIDSVGKLVPHKSLNLIKKDDSTWIYESENKLLQVSIDVKNYYKTGTIISESGGRTKPAIRDIERKSETT